MRCEGVRELLPDYIDRDLHEAGEIEVHLATCAACSAELAAYRELMAELAMLAEGDEDPSPELLERVVALAPYPSIPARVVGAVQERPLMYTLASLGGAAVGASAIAIVWWRMAHRAGSAGERVRAAAG